MSIRKRATQLWCILAFLLHGYWVFAGGAPLGAADDDAASMGSWLAGASARPVSAVLSVTALTALAALTAATRRDLPGWVRTAGLLAPALLFLLVPDVRMLQTAAYGMHGYFGRVDAAVLHQLFCLTGAILLASTALADLHRPAEPRQWVRIGRWATIFAALAPLPYAVQRAVWNLGIPLGVDREFIRDLSADLSAKDVSPLIAYSLPASALLGSVLTLGLIMRWGEVLPGWVPGLGGRRVPVLLAVIPGTVMSVMITVAGLSVLRFALQGGLTGAGVPGLLWLPWGIALGLATYAYYQRRTTSCATRRL
ncbi:hypothetical protein LWF15_16945 [Kineosporia rhizophila]|uniref:hypothetical protein n=1 Tax=Kineosporia rhizophila TaxID=84633 RepID=UPI001E36F3D4|nr:hypothetical protein [Kineosporia rhizophila]MCE0537191.1 hypothetical protein [Kineosporia rhizophila]